MWTLICTFCLIVSHTDWYPVSSCNDLNTTDCVQLQSAQPNLCHDRSFGSSACVRFCGNCPVECYSCPKAVRDPTECRTIATCQPDEVCLLKHLTSKDGHQEYIMACEKKTICDVIELSFTFGRRDIEVEEVSISCCHTDYCNSPVHTTVLPPMTTNKRSSCARDIVFLLDASNSVDSLDVTTCVQFMTELVKQLSIGQDDALVSLLTYGTHVNIEWDLDTFDTKNDLLNALNHIRVGNGSTQTDEALDVVRTKILTPSGGDRPSYDNVVIILSNNGFMAEILNSMHQLYNETHGVVAIFSNTSPMSEPQVNYPDSDRNHVVFYLRYTGLLNIIVQDVLNVICMP